MIGVVFKILARTPMPKFHSPPTRFACLLKNMNNSERFFGPDLGPNCLQKLSAANIR